MRHGFILNSSGTPNAAYVPPKPHQTHGFKIEWGERVSIAHNTNSGQAPWFIWQDVGTSSQKVITYKLQLSRSADMTDIVYEKDGLASSNHQLENDFYANGATYYVKVHATDSVGNSNTSTVVPQRYVLKTVQYKLITASVSGNLVHRRPRVFGFDWLCHWQNSAIP